MHRTDSRLSAPTDTLPPMIRSVPACPHCATADEQPLACDRCGWRWYANPRPAAAVLLERQAADDAEPSILLLKRAVEPGYGEWDLPAGYLDPGESFEMAARRETLEESGIAVTLIGLSGVYHSAPANAVTAVFRARALDATSPVRLDAESSDHAWVPRSQLGDWLPRIAFDSMASAIGDWARPPPDGGSH
jgi:ADP-ribose pyrophosphatase YjhB (NUDIX family)